MRYDTLARVLSGYRAAAVSEIRAPKQHVAAFGDKVLFLQAQELGLLRNSLNVGREFRLKILIGPKTPRLFRSLELTTVDEFPHAVTTHVIK